MPKFTDTITIRVKAGSGGHGAVSFRREKYIPRGGPDGGDGGRGGNVYIKSNRSYYNLSHLFRDRLYRAGKGGSGMGGNRSGKDGKDLCINVPPGTQIINAETGDLMADLVEEGRSCLVAEGGMGGRGNAFFKSSTNQAPRFSQPGIKTEEFSIRLNLKLIADIGFVGLPNSGKSTLLSKITRAKPKIGSYPFTTLIPNLGVFEGHDGRIYKIADIPGIIEGAHKGHGLGLSFLRHIERVKVIFYLIDSGGNDLNYNLELLKSELSVYNRDLLKRPYYVLLTKADLLNEDEIFKKRAQINEDNILAISSLSGYNMTELNDIINKLMGSVYAA